MGEAVVNKALSFRRKTASSHRPVQKTSIEPMRRHVVEERFVSIGPITQEFRGQPQFQAHHRNTIRATCDQDVVLPRATANALHPIGVDLLLNRADL